MYVLWCLIIVIILCRFDSNISKLSMEAVASLASHCCSQPACLQVPYVKEGLQDYLRVHVLYATMYIYNVQCIV